MRMYFTTTIARTKEIWRNGWRDSFDDEFGMQGVWFASEPLDANDGVEGDVVLCMEISEEDFRPHEVEDPIHWYGRALIPADVLNRIGKPQVYDHEYAGISRRDLLGSIRWLETNAAASEEIAVTLDEPWRGNEAARRHAQEMRDA